MNSPVLAYQTQSRCQVTTPVGRNEFVNQRIHVSSCLVWKNKKLKGESLQSRPQGEG